MALNKARGADIFRSARYTQSLVADFGGSFEGSKGLDARQELPTSARYLTVEGAPRQTPRTPGTLGKSAFPLLLLALVLFVAS